MDYYAHTIKKTDFSIHDIYKLNEIFKSGYLLSRRLLREYGDTSDLSSEKTMLYNGMDYISLCDLKKNHNGYSSYNSYVRNGLSLLFDHNIEVIEPFLIDKNIYDFFNVRNLDLINNRYTDFKDEVQAKDKISMDYLRGICFASSSFFVNHSKDYYKLYVNLLEEVLKEYNYDVPIYNLDTWEKIKIKR